MAKFDYKKAEADLHDSGARHPDEIYEYKSEKAIRGYMKENGLNPDKYYKPNGKSNRSKSGSTSDSGSEGCYLTSACVTARGLPDQCEELQTCDPSAMNTWLGNQVDRQKLNSIMHWHRESSLLSTNCPMPQRYGILSTKNWWNRVSR